MFRRFAGWRLDAIGRALFDPDDVVINLSDGEFRLLMALVEHPRRVLTRDFLLDHARGANAEHFDRAIDVQISRLRRKLGRAGDELIRTIRNEGYMFAGRCRDPLSQTVARGARRERGRSPSPSSSSSSYP